jgi:hypothetical protein
MTIVWVATWEPHHANSQVVSVATTAKVAKAKCDPKAPWEEQESDIPGLPMYVEQSWDGYLVQPVELVEAAE